MKVNPRKLRGNEGERLIAMRLLGFCNRHVRSGMLTTKTLAVALAIGGAALLGAGGNDRTIPRSRDKGKPNAHRPIERRPQARGGGVSFDDVWSREFSILNGDTTAQAPVFGDVISREFSIHRYAPDLAVSNMIATPTNLTSQVFTLSWTVTNAGQRTAAGLWFDQVKIANQVVFCLPNAGDLAPGGSHTRTESICFPEGIQQTGAYTVDVIVDVDDSVAEQVGTSNNSDNNKESIVINLQNAFSPLPACAPPPQCLLANVPGFNVEIYATGITLGVGMAIANDGTIYFGREIGPGSHEDDPARILRVGIGGAPTSEYGNQTIIDPDTVLFDERGLLSGVARSVLVGAGGSLIAVRPDQSIHTLFLPGVLSNLGGMAFDHNGRWLAMDDDELPTGFGRIHQITGGVPTELTYVSCDVGPWDCGGAWLAVGQSNEIYSWWYDGWIRVHDENGNLLIFEKVMLHLPTIRYRHA
jgi:hypothetical protein